MEMNMHEHRFFKNTSDPAISFIVWVGGWGVCVRTWQMEVSQAKKERCRAHLKRSK